MSKVQQIEAEIQKLSPAELQQLRNWLDDLLEDQLAGTVITQLTVELSSTSF